MIIFYNINYCYILFPIFNNIYSITILIEYLYYTIIFLLFIFITFYGSDVETNRIF